jgi:hypothetical protein
MMKRTENFKMESYVVLIATLVLSVLATSCQSTLPTNAKTEPLETNLRLDELVLGKPVKINEHLPVYYPVKIVHAQDENGNVLTKNNLSFKAWDFNHDGRVDYIEAFDKYNNVVYRVVDLFGEAKVIR